MKVLVTYRAAPRIRGWETGKMVADAFRELGHETYEFAKLYQKLSLAEDSGVSEDNFDLILNMECNDPDPQNHVFSLKKRTKKRAFWHFDTSYYIDLARKHIWLHKPDHVFFANANWRQYGVQNSSWLPYAADPKFFRSITPDKDFDIGFVGTIRPDRQQLIEEMRVYGVKVGVISDVFKSDYIDALSRCRVIINQNPPEGNGLLNMRTFEAPAAGAVLLSDDVSYIHEILLPGSQCFIYNGTSDVPFDYVTDSKSYDGLGVMAKSAQDWIKSSHMYTNRVQEILEILF